MATFHCEMPSHDGPRLISDPFDRVTVSLDFMRPGTGTVTEQRIYRIDLREARTFDRRPIGPGHVCRTCADRWAQAIGRGSGELDGQAALFGEGV
jgi:hypothetical protein